MRPLAAHRPSLRSDTSSRPGTASQRLEAPFFSFCFARSCTQPSPGEGECQFQPAGSAGTGTVSESPPSVCGCVDPMSVAATLSGGAVDSCS